MLDECTNAQGYFLIVVFRGLLWGFNLKFPFWEVSDKVPSLGEDRCYGKAREEAGHLLAQSPEPS